MVNLCLLKINMQCPDESVLRCEASATPSWSRRFVVVILVGRSALVLAGVRHWIQGTLCPRSSTVQLQYLNDVIKNQVVDHHRMLRRRSTTFNPCSRLYGCVKRPGSRHQALLTIIAVLFYFWTT